MAPYYYRRRWRPYWRKRYRPYWRRRTGKAFRSRRRRRRTHRVRRKLLALPLKQWQPKYINKLCIKGLFCLFQAHKVHYNQNYNQYANTTVPEGLSNGGGFTIVRFTLQSLFDLHDKARNYWTKSNKNMPLFRYTGAKIKVYRPLDTDLVLKFQTCYPMCCSKLTFTGTQPSILMMTHGSKKIRCKRTAPNLKPYKTFRLKPPQQMTNKWYFQHNECNTGLLMIQASAASFDNYYTSSSAQSSTIQLHSLNTKIFQNLNFQNPSATTGYQPKTIYYLWALGTEDKVKNLIYLGQSKKYNQGIEIQEAKSQTQSPESKIQTYFSNPDNWGNPFHRIHLHQSMTKYYFSETPPTTAVTTSNYNQDVDKTNTFTQIHEPFLINIRYNPFTDKGYNNIYILPNNKSNIIGNQFDLNPPDDPDLQNPGFPNWLSCFGFRDYLIKLNKHSKINNNFIMLITTKHFEPFLNYYILVDDFFIKGDSEELIGVNSYDNLNWYPQIKNQQGALNTLALCGPGAAKLGNVTLAEAKIEYQFYFKVGGCAKPLEKVKDPSAQPTYVTPANVLDTNSLQSPEEPIESFLYQFDWRRDQITESAAQRILKDYPTKKHLFTDAGCSATEVPIWKTHEKDLQSSEEEEAQKETLFEQLNRHRIQQKDLRHRIKLLLAQLQSIE
nr:MAG: ORF1 [TTV-like mini virus]